MFVEERALVCCHARTRINDLARIERHIMHVISGSLDKAQRHEGPRTGKKSLSGVYKVKHWYCVRTGRKILVSTHFYQNSLLRRIIDIILVR